MSQSRGWGHRRPIHTILHATSNSATAERIEDILSGTMPPKEGFGWVISLIYMCALNVNTTPTVTQCRNSACRNRNCRIRNCRNRTCLPKFIAPNRAAFYSVLETCSRKKLVQECMAHAQETCTSF